MKLRVLLNGLCGTLTASSLFLIMVLTALDVTGRRLFENSIPGSLELTEILMVGVIFTSLPLVSLNGEHVAFDSLDAWTPPTIRRIQGSLVELFSAAIFAGMGWMLWSKAAEMSGYGDVTPQLGLPVGLFVYGMSLLCALTAIVHLSLMMHRPATPSAA